ncbi:ATP-binding protein [Nocardioides aurantiacus]|uniref:ATP-binding protein n=1 Tax=Nocardioides aurantiacus TaxID=86796 RepID=UPI00403FBA07
MSTTGNESDLSYGSILRVRRVDDPAGRVWFDRRDGASGWFSRTLLDDVEAGQILYVPNEANDDDPVRLLSEEDWLIRGGDVATVSLISEDGSTAVLDVNGRHQTFAQRVETPFVKGQTIAVDADGRPGAVLSSKPVDRFGRGVDEVDPESFLVELGGVSLADFGGSRALVERAIELAKVALDPQRRLEQIGVNSVKGMLFSGPSGTGKTHLARVLSEVLGTRFYLIDGPEIINKWVGESEQRLRELFRHAEDHAPAIIFFDELDSIVASRGGDAPEYASRFVGQFLTVLDGFQASRGVLVIAATNLPGALDTALLRPGRLTFKLEFNGHPSPADRLKILRASARGVQGAQQTNWPLLVEATDGWSAAELAMIWTEAGVLAVLDERLELCEEDVMGGLARAARNREVSRRQGEQK